MPVGEFAHSGTLLLDIYKYRYNCIKEFVPNDTLETRMAKWDYGIDWIRV